MAETTAEKVQDLVLGFLFAVIAVVALFKCRRVVVLEGAEVGAVSSCFVFCGGGGGWMDHGSARRRT